MAKADLRVGPYERNLHRPGTKGAAGRCSWTQHCTDPPQFTAVVIYSESGRCFVWALCDAHERRVRDFFATP